MSKAHKALRSLSVRFSILGEFFSFLAKRKLWWSIPLLIVILLLLLIILFGQATGIAPFIYPLF